MGGVISNTAYAYFRPNYAFSLSSWNVDANESGTITFDVTVGGTSIINPGSTPAVPALSTQQNTSGSTSGWQTTSFSANTLFKVTLTGSVTSVTYALLTLNGSRT